jgi:aminopeptidase N
MSERCRGCRSRRANVLSIVVLFALLTGCGQKQAYVAGSANGPDPYYPALGNGGYDAQDYEISLLVDPPSNDVQAQVLIDAVATEPLSSFRLDYAGPPISELKVNNKIAKFERNGDELIVTPAQGLAAGSKFEIEARYHGAPLLTADVSGAPIDGLGWAHSGNGAINVMNEPSGARGWFPVNDHPSDKANYTLKITVPEPWIVAASGRLISKEKTDAGTLYQFASDGPMASYLASVNVDRYEVTEMEGPNKLPVRAYFPPGYPDDLKKNYRKIPEMMSYFSDVFGPYPFSQYASVVANTSIPYCEGSGAAAEQQALAVYCPSERMAQEDVLAHELAHQWFGNSVSLKRWKDLWLKEGMATYAEWLWLTRGKDRKVLDRLVRVRANGYYPEVPVGEPPADNLYQSEAYEGGGLVFHALRLKVGDEAFFEILRTYLERYRDQSAGTEDFVAIAEEVSGQELSAQFEEWLYKVGKPEFAP